MTVTREDYKSNVENAWCPGCGNFAILNSIKGALVDLQLAPHQVLMVTGIGQAPKLPHYVKVNTYNGLHGREVASATAAKLAADDLTVIVHAGDGGAYGEGGNHLIHAIRRNIDITVVVHDNHTYGLTKGQASPTTDEGVVTSVNPGGVHIHPLNPLALAISQSCSFVGQGSSAHPEHLKELLKKAIQNSGFSLVNVLQPCISWDKVHTFAYYREHCFEISNEHNPADRMAALALALGASDKFPIGVIYTESRDVYDKVVLQNMKHPLRDRGIDPTLATKLFDRFR